MDGFGYGAGLGTGSSHHRTMGRRLDFRAVWGFLPTLGEAQQAALKGAVQELPGASGIGMANWNWRVVHRFVSERFGISLSRSSCLNYLHRLGFVLKRPKKWLVKANEAKRETFVAEYAALSEEAQRTGARIFFADEAHVRADAELRGKWVLKGEPALVESPVSGVARKPATIRRCAWRRGRWSGWKQQRRNLGCLPDAAEGEAPRTIERDLGQRSGAPGARQSGSTCRRRVWG